MALALKEQGKIMEASHHFGYGLSLNSSVSCFVPQLFAVPRAPSLGTLWFDFFRETPPLGRGSEEEESLPSCMGRRKHLGVQLFHMQFCNQPPVLWHFLGTQYFLVLNFAGVYGIHWAAACQHPLRRPYSSSSSALLSLLLLLCHLSILQDLFLSFLFHSPGSCGFIPI